MPRMLDARGTPTATATDGGRDSTVPSMGSLRSSAATLQSNTAIISIGCTTALLAQALAYGSACSTWCNPNSLQAWH